MKAQALRDSSVSSYVASKKTPELNPTNPIVKELKRKVAEEDKADKPTRDLTYLLFEIALLTSGFTLGNPTSFAKRTHRTIGLGLDVDNAEEAVVAEPSSEPVATDDTALAAEGTSTFAMEEID